MTHSAIARVTAATVVVAVDLLAALWSLVPETRRMLPEVVSGAPKEIAVVLGVHAMCALAVGVLLARTAPPFLRHTVREVGVFAACFAFFVPVLGPLGVVVVLMLGLTEPRPAACEPWLSHEAPVGIDGRRRRQPRLRRGLPVAEISDALRRRGTEHAGERFRCVLAIRHLPPNVAVPLLRFAQSDPSDEVRLYAFSRLESMRGELEKRVEQLTAALAVAESEEAPRLQLRLAESHWELGYSGLTEGAVRDHALKCAHQHAAIACELLPEHAAAEFFLGKVLLELHEPSRATIAFERAASAGYPRWKLLVYLAECAFRQRDFVSVRTLLEQLEASPHEGAEFGGVIELWTRTEQARHTQQRPAELTTAQQEHTI